MNYIEGIPREQIFLFNECIDEIIEKDNIVRFIDAYVESLDMKGLGFKIPKGNTGTPPYRPQLKLKIYIYGYFEKIRSSRRLEKECHRNKELIWLTEGLAPDFKTIADFRKENHKAFRNIFKNFLKLCYKLDLLSFKTVAIDGTKMRGQNSLNEVYKNESIEKVEKEIEEQVNNYLKELDEIDKKEQVGSFSLNQDKIQEITNRLNKQLRRKDKIGVIKDLFSRNPDLKTYFATDNDSRLQSDKGKVRPGYNPQIAVEEKNKLIVVADVTNEQNDKKQLTPMVNQVKEVKNDLRVEDETNAITDSGYYSEKEIINNNQDGFNVIVSPDAENKKLQDDIDGRTGLSEKYQQEDFNYDKEKDVYICPEGNELRKTNKKVFSDKNGREVNSYNCKPEICNNCLRKEYCTNGKHGRKLLVSANKDIMQLYLEFLNSEKNKRLINKRKELVEHPFGTIKRNLGYTHFLLKGLYKVTAEFSFICFIYNLKRVLNIVPRNELLAAVNE